MARAHPDGADIFGLFERHVNPGLARVMRFMGLETYEVSAEGVWVTDSAGTRYLDFSSGYGVMIHGYRHPKILEAARRQMERLTLSSRVLLSAEAVELAALLDEVTPGDLSVSFFANSGAEAVEAAMKFARIATGRAGIVAMEGAFHGKTMGSLSVSGRRAYQEPFAPLVPDVHHVPFGDLASAEAAVDEGTAAVIVEPIQGEGGIIVPEEGYLRGLRELTRRRGALLVVDEVQSGMGRTGRLWASEHEGVDPDILTAAKGLGGGVIPAAAAVGTPEVMSFFDREPLIHTSTFGGNPLAAAVAKAAIEVALEEGLPERAAVMGERVLAFGRHLAETYPAAVREVRGRGLLLGLDTGSEAVGGALMYELLSREMLAVYTLNNPTVIRLMPPLVMSDEELQMGLERLEAACAAVQEMAADLGED